ncbi:hypothetical protein D3C87_1100110 [compost metagenome]
MSNKAQLNQMCPSAAAAAIGTKLEAVITLLNDVKAAFNAHCADTTVHAEADETNPVETPDVPSLD